MAAKIDKIEREELGKRHFYDEDDELEEMMNAKTTEEDKEKKAK